LIGIDEAFDLVEADADLGLLVCDLLLDTLHHGRDFDHELDDSPERNRRPGTDARRAERDTLRPLGVAIERTC
jgi:hypothetical protein